MSESEYYGAIKLASKEELHDLMTKALLLQERISGGDLFVAGVDSTGGYLHSGLWGATDPDGVKNKKVISVDCGYAFTACLLDNRRVIVLGATNNRGFKRAKYAKDVKSIACSSSYVICVTFDGDAIAYYDNDPEVLMAAEDYENDVMYNVPTWDNLDRVYTSDLLTVVGVKKDGTVVACGFNENNQCAVEGWTDIFTVACGHHFTVGLKNDGTLVSCGNDTFIKKQVARLKNITSIHAVGDMFMAVDAYNQIVYQFMEVNGEIKEDANPVPQIMTLKTTLGALIAIDKSGAVVNAVDTGLVPKTNEYARLRASAYCVYESEIPYKYNTVIKEMHSKGYLNIAGWKLCESLDDLVNEREEWEAGNVAQSNENGFSAEDNTTQSIQSSTSGGCYIATCVYGSYDCPEVWTLRRFRDDTLASTALGREFIRTYYAISPTLVKWFGESGWFRSFWSRILDKIVSKLNSDGVENTPYDDRDWN